MKDVPGFEGRYAVTEDGKVWSYPKEWCGGHHWMFRKITIINWYAHTRFALGKNKQKNFKVHRLVALTYLQNVDNHPIVRHLDNNKLNNHISNLEWCSHQTNVRQAYSDWLIHITEKLRASWRINWAKQWKANWKKVMQLTKEWILCKIYDSTCDAYRNTGITQTNIAHCANWKRNRAGWYYWQYC